MRIAEMPSALQSLEMIMGAPVRKIVPEREDSPFFLRNEAVTVYIDRATGVADSVSVRVRDRDGDSYYGIVSDRVTVNTEGVKPVSVVFGNREQTLVVSGDGKVIFQRVDARV